MMTIHLVVGDAWRTVCGLWADAVDTTDRVENVTCERCLETPARVGTSRGSVPASR